MNKYCETCYHLAQGKETLNLFDKLAEPTFFHCPQENPFVVGCLTKNLPVDWDNFREFLKANNIEPQTTT